MQGCAQAIKMYLHVGLHAFMTFEHFGCPTQCLASVGAKAEAGALALWQAACAPRCGWPAGFAAACLQPSCLQEPAQSNGIST